MYDAQKSCIVVILFRTLFPLYKSKLTSKEIMIQNVHPIRIYTQVTYKILSKIFETSTGFSKKGHYEAVFPLISIRGKIGHSNLNSLKHPKKHSSNLGKTAQQLL